MRHRTKPQHNEAGGGNRRAGPPLFVRRILAELKRMGVCGRGESAVLAVSGGADSTALLAAMHMASGGLGLDLHVAHLNHCLRGADSNRDEAFVRAMARKWRLPFLCAKADVAAAAAKNGVSIEMAARQARQAFLVETAGRVKAAVVLTAHTADDQVETALMRFARGAGTRGMAGIQPLTRIDGVVFARPMLGVSKREAVAFLRSRNLAWREDKSNLSPFAIRNRVRHEVLPLIEARLNPSARRAILRACEVLRDEDAWMDAVAEKLLDACRAACGKPSEYGCAISRVPLAGCPPAAWRRVLRLWLVAAGAPASALEFESVEKTRRAWAGQGKTWRLCLPRGRLLEKKGDVLAYSLRGACGEIPAGGYRRRIALPGQTPIPEYGCVIAASAAPGIAREPASLPGATPTRASISRTAVGRKAVFARSWLPGDRFKPLGMSGSRKVQDIFGDAKTPREERGRIPLLECGGEIVWIPGCRVARGWEVRRGERLAWQLKVEKR